ncbi:MAG TPA: ABC transporter permease [Ornithinibacter sp.]|nr:ABC transporter permease [Ornithinibacter sp.]
MSGVHQPGRAWPLVARREIATKLVDRTFLLSTFVTIAIITGFVAVQAVLSERGSDYRLVATASDTAMAQNVAERAPSLDDKVRVTVEGVADEAAARDALERERADVWLVSRDAGWLLVGRDEVPEGLEAVAATVVREETLAANAQAAGTTVEAITRGTVLGTEVLVGDPQQRGFADAMAFALAFLFYLASVGFGTALAGSVVEEKQSRIVEIIATKIPVRELLAGKVLGNTALAVLQMALYGVIGVVGLSFTSYGALLATVTGALAWFLVFFLVGFLLIACLWAVAGALASRSEDLQSTSMPITLVLLGIFFGSLFLDGPAQTVLSYVPPASAVLMPLRVLDGSAAPWEPFVSLAILLASAAVVVLVAERLYRRSLLQTQGRISVRQAWSAPE